MTKKNSPFVTSFKKAVNPLLVLTVLKTRPMYGYEIASIIEKEGNGEYTIALLYPILYKLQAQGYIRESGIQVIDNRARSYYEITEQGEAFLKDTLAEYQHMTDIFQQIMENLYHED